jgi:hypothetical protein
MNRDMTIDEMKRQYRARQEQIRKLEAERAEAIGRGDPVPGRVRFALAEARISAEELRMWGNRELTRQLREAK